MLTLPLTAALMFPVAAAELYLIAVDWQATSERGALIDMQK